MKMKCRICNKYYDEKDFGFCRNAKNKRLTVCSKCYNSKSYQWKNNNLSKRKYDKLKAREYRFKHKYGLSERDYKRMVIMQEGDCLICKKYFGTKLVVDHCHSSGKVRGLLCKNCNTGIGMLAEDINNFKNSIKYLN